MRRVQLDPFLLGCALELLLAAVALLLARWWGLPVADGFEWRVNDVLAGVLASLPLLGLFWIALRSRHPGLRAIRQLLDEVLRPLFVRWSLVQLAFISLLAGVCEELLFRAVIQNGLAQALGTVPGLVLTGVIFGLCHWINRVYALIAGVIGIYLGGVWLLTNNLLAPMVAHAVYDFLALLLLVRGSRSVIRTTGD